jgi:hypothetical protein
MGCPLTKAACGSGVGEGVIVGGTGVAVSATGVSTACGVTVGSIQAVKMKTPSKAAHNHTRIRFIGFPPQKQFGQSRTIKDYRSLNQYLRCKSYLRN